MIYFFVNCTCVRTTIVSLNKPNDVFVNTYGRHSKIGLTNFWGILHRAARVRKQKTIKKSYVLSYVLNIITNWHKHSFSSSLRSASTVRVDKNVACFN
jgi:hypothetical protein